MPKKDNDAAKQAVIREWDTWAPKNPADTTGGLMFFLYLQKEHPDLLQFKYPGDKWQCVHGWLLSARRVSN